MANKIDTRESSSAGKRPDMNPNRDHPDIPEGSVHDEPKGTPSAERYQTEIASAKLRRR